MIENRRKLIGLAHTAFAMVAAPVAALAQTPTTPSPAAPPADGSAAGLVSMVGVLLAFFVAIGIAVKIYDAKRKREEQGVALPIASLRRAASHSGSDFDARRGERTHAAPARLAPRRRA